MHRHSAKKLVLLFFLLALPRTDEITVYYLQGSNGEQELECKNSPLLRKYSRINNLLMLSVSMNRVQSRPVLASPEAASDYDTVFVVIRHEVFPQKFSVFHFYYLL